MINCRDFRLTNTGVAVVLMSNAVGYAEEEVVSAAANVVFSMLGAGGE